MPTSRRAAPLLLPPIRSKPSFRRAARDDVRRASRPASSPARRRSPTRRAGGCARCRWPGSARAGRRRSRRSRRCHHPWMSTGSTRRSPSAAAATTGARSGIRYPRNSRSTSCRHRTRVACGPGDRVHHRVDASPARRRRGCEPPLDRAALGHDVRRRSTVDHPTFAVVSSSIRPSRMAATALAAAPIALRPSSGRMPACAAVPGTPHRPVVGRRATTIADRRGVVEHEAELGPQPAGRTPSHPAARAPRRS